jgi:hypothetical protein
VSMPTRELCNRTTLELPVEKCTILNQLRDMDTHNAQVMDVATNVFCASGMHLPNGSEPDQLIGALPVLIRPLRLCYLWGERSYRSWR